MGPRAHFVHYFVAAGRLVNFVAVTEEDSWLRESWVDRGEVGDALAAFVILAQPSPIDHWRSGRYLQMGPVRPQPVAALVGRTGHAFGRLVPSDAAVYGPRCRAGD